MKLFVLLIMPMFAQANAIDFKRDIRPVFVNRCTGCHNGSNALPNILDEDVALENRYAIKTKVQSKKMPLYGQMTQAEREMVINWVNQGE
jgi:uncharacterized membrane protein